MTKKRLVDPWVKRMRERNALLNELREVIVEQRKRTRDPILFNTDLCAAFVEYFQTVRFGRQLPTGNVCTDERFLLWGNYAEKKDMSVKKALLPRIQKFARKPEETLEMMSRLFLWVAESLVHDYNASSSDAQLVSEATALSLRDSL